MPLEELDDVADPESSTGSNLDAGKAKAEPIAAKPSSANDVPDDDDALSVVRDAVTEKEKPESSVASSAAGKEVGEDSDDEQPKKQDDENFSDVPFHKHPRFQQLLRKSKAYQEDAVRYQNVQNFLNNQGLSAEEAADALTTAALMKSDPVQAWEVLRPKMQALLQAAGEVLPTDLQQQVDQGTMPRAAAIEVSRARAALQAATSRRSFDQQQLERRQQSDHVRSLMQAAENWEAHRRARDPNFDAKLAPLQKAIENLQIIDGMPRDPEGVREQLRKAYKAVNDAIPAGPANGSRRAAITPVRGGQVAGTNGATPGSTLDIIRAHRRTA